MTKPSRKAKTVAAALTAALVFGATPAAAFGTQASAQGGTDLAAGTASLQTQALKSGKASKAAKSKKNKKARKAYKKKLAKLKKQEYGMAPKYRFIDLTNDGIDEMIVMWWPSIYTYKNGKVKKVDNREYGGVNYAKSYKKKKVITYNVPDHMGASVVCYAKWNGKKFKTVATTYEPTYAKSQGNTPTYTVKGKRVSKDKATAYIKKLIGKAKATNIGYSTYKTYK